MKASNKAAACILVAAMAEHVWHVTMIGHCTWSMLKKKYWYAVSTQQCCRFRNEQKYLVLAVARYYVSRRRLASEWLQTAARVPEPPRDGRFTS
jgi:hypothetical protein